MLYMSQTVPSSGAQKKMPDTVCAVLSSWWWTEKPSERVECLTWIKILRNVASCWLYSANILSMHRPTNVKFVLLVSASVAVCSGTTSDSAVTYIHNLQNAAENTPVQFVGIFRQFSGLIFMYMYLSSSTISPCFSTNLRHLCLWNN